MSGGDLRVRLEILILTIKERIRLINMRIATMAFAYDVSHIVGRYGVGLIREAYPLISWPIAA